MSRTDDIINVAGHRLSTGRIEEAISSHSHVAECCVIGAHDPIKGQIPLAFIVLKNNVNPTLHTIEKEVKEIVRERVGAISSLKGVLVVSILPKTRSGKILRSTIKKIADCSPFKIPPTIDNVDALQEISRTLTSSGHIRN